MTLKTIYQTVLAIVFSTVVSVSAVTAAEVKTLSADEVRKAFIGNTLDTGKTFVFWGADGVIKGKSRRGPTDTGEYSIKDNGQYCRKWENWRGGSEECVMIKRAGDDFATVRLDGSVRGTFKILKGNPEGL